MEVVFIDLPQSWEDLTPKDVVFVANARKMMLTREEYLVYCFNHFAGIKLKRDHFTGQYNPYICKKRCIISGWDLNKYAEMLAWTLDTPFNITNPTKINDHLIGITFEQYYKANVMFMQYNITHELKYARMAYCELTEKRFTFIGKTKMEAISLWWTSVQNMLKELYPCVFRSNDGGEGMNPMQVLQNIKLMLNDGKPQDNEAILHSEVNDVLAALNAKIKEADELMKKSKKK